MAIAVATEMPAARATGKAALNPVHAGTRRPMRCILPAIPVLAAPLLVAAMAAADPTDPAYSGGGSGNDASYADNAFPQGTGAAGGGGKVICIIF